MRQGVKPLPEPGALGLNVKRLREAKGLSQNALAKVSGVSQAFISDVERGHRQAAMSTILAALARALGVTVDELLRENGEE